MAAPQSSSGMFCSISGIVPDVPVVSAKSGHIFERRLIEQALEASDGRCPETGEPLSTSDLIEIKKSGTVVEPLVPAEVSVPGVLRHLQKEWDTTMLELHQVKTELNETRKELANALYKYETAERVIAKMNQDMKESATARASDEVQTDETNGARVEAAAAGEVKKDATQDSKTSDRVMVKDKVVTGRDATADVSSSTRTEFPEELLKKVKARSAELQKKRKERKVPASHARADTLKSLSETGQVAVDGSEATVTSLARGADGLMYGGTSSGKLMTLDTRGMGVVGKAVVGHTDGGVKRVRWDGERVVSCGAGSVKIWDGQTWEQLGGWEETGEVVDVDVHPTKEVVFVVLAEGKWVWRELGGRVVCEGQGGEGYGSGVVHPDGMVFATGRTDGVVEMWDLRTMKCVAELGERGGRVVSLEMSEKGYYMASCRDGRVSLWDLRKQTVSGEVGMEGVVGLALDGVGEFGGAVGAGGVAVFMGKKKTKTVVKVPMHKWQVGGAGRQGCAWGDDAGCIVVGGADGTVRQYGAGVQ
ncbi:Putative Pre-mRNA-processing factor 19 [Chondrus crispus]|uniref:Pre-mRNA-processing factor 19 n=1 Tax=Chondrus crispus TaxID=2769 RepID=R7Q9H2_CHOCR|nr:Putative Pre-mRNA-processing factor 19 [Chondrus crispus]CDF35187.1 Putative Pre-mRNA-processing factor 19 [Chondrus crispus]|eukprot:XP_005715006.1 Putative Pre-mRNA-processing factor 19 [Chondrus crispus]